MSADREPEKRHDLAPAHGENRMGGETFTVIEKRIYTAPTGKRTEIVLDIRRNVQIGDGK